jgi:hypothetical protein
MVLLATGAFSVAAAGPAAAFPCPAGQPCFWEQANRGGNWIRTGIMNYVGDPYNDRASSFENRTTRNVVWWWDTNCRGNVAMILGPGRWQNASWFNNDETSSVCWG